MRRVHVADVPSEIGEAFVVDGDEAHHLVRVLRAREGDVFGVFDGAGREVEARVVSVEKRRATLEVVGLRTPRRAPRDVTLCTAIPRGQRMEALVEKCTEVGVARIVPLRTARGVRDSASDNHLRRWQRAALEAAKQCGRADVPEVEQPMSLPAALAAVDGCSVLLADPAARRGVSEAARDAGPLALFVGPEGGFDDAERAAITEAGAESFGLGPLILRIETAAVVAVHTAVNAAQPRTATPS